MAEAADKHEVYQRAVQSPEVDIELLKHFYNDCHKRNAYHFREDFCGTGLTMAHWVAQGKRYSGEGYDIDEETVEWGRQHNIGAMALDPERAALYIADARDPSQRKPDIRCAFNFSYWVFQQRQQMIDYFIGVRDDLADKGIFVVDVTGGTESLTEEPVETDAGDFTLIWQQSNFSPIDHSADLSLTFRFSDGSQIEPPYRYHWRVWSIPEIIEMLEQAGFSETRIWLQDYDAAEPGYRRTTVIDNDPCWIACIVVLK